MTNEELEDLREDFQALLDFEKECVNRAFKGIDCEEPGILTMCIEGFIEKWSCNDNHSDA